MSGCSSLPLVPQSDPATESSNQLLRLGHCSARLLRKITMKKALTYMVAAGTLALMACGPFLASAAEAGRGRYHHHGHSHGLGNRRYGWGWDSIYGYYVGPIFGRSGISISYRCFEPGYGWHVCPHY